MNKTTSSQDGENLGDSSNTHVNVQEPSNKALVPGLEQSAVLLKRRVDEDVLLSGEDDASKRQKNFDVARPGILARRESFVFRYQKDQPFVNDKEACADMCRLIKGPSTFPPVEEMEEAEAYKEFARATTRMLSYANLLTGTYDRKLKAANGRMKEMDELKKRCDKAKYALKEEKVKSVNLEIQVVVLNAQVAKLKADNEVFATEIDKFTVERESLMIEKEKLLSEITKLKSETQRLRESREQCIQKERQKAQPRISRGAMITEVDMALKEANRMKLEAQIKEMDIFKLRETDPTMTLNRHQRSQTVLPPSVVNQHRSVTSIENIPSIVYSREEGQDRSSPGAAETTDEVAEFASNYIG